jgi:hypothetical protein
MFLTARFNTDTYTENKRYREIHKVKCIYNPAVPISDRHPPGKYYILEMNIDTNKLLGIGIIQKQLQPCVQIYKDPSYNRYTYMGNDYITLDKLPESMIEYLEKKLFYGKTHMKRGMGLTKFPDIWVTGEIVTQAQRLGLPLRPIL